MRPLPRREITGDGFAPVAVPGGPANKNVGAHHPLPPVGAPLSQIPGVIDDLTAAGRARRIGDFATAPLVLAQGGATSGARGVAYAAWSAHD